MSWFTEMDALCRHPSSFPQPLCALSFPVNPGGCIHSHCTHDLVFSVRSWETWWPSLVPAWCQQWSAPMQGLLPCWMPSCTSRCSPRQPQLLCTWLEVRERLVSPSRIRWERLQGLAAATLGGALRKGEARCAFLHPRWVLHLEMGTEATAGSLSLRFHMSQQHVKDTACHCRSWRWSWGLMEVRQRKGGDSYLTWFQSGNWIIYFIPLCNLAKWGWSNAKH